MQEICDLVYRECWKDFPNFNFPNGNNGTGGNNNNGSNNNPNTTGGGTHGDAANIFQIKSTTLSTWMDANDVPDEFFNLPECACTPMAHYLRDGLMDRIRP